MVTQQGFLLVLVSVACHIASNLDVRLILVSILLGTAMSTSTPAIRDASQTVHNAIGENACFSFGLIGDTQYVDADDGSTFDGSVIRRYRQSLSTLEKACESFREQNVSLCILLGDTLDGKCKFMGNEERCLQDIYDVLKLSNSPWHFCIGNHDLVCFSREQILEKLMAESVRHACSPSQLYYDFSPTEGYRFIFLDGYEVSTISAITDEYSILAAKLLSDCNPNLSIPGASWFDGLSIEKKRFVPYNGGIGVIQLKWFDNILKVAEENNERCFVFSHMPCNVDCCRAGGLIWNSEDVIEIMHRYKGTVAAFIAGHDHDGGYAIDGAGIHHLVPPSPLECAEKEVAYGHITIYPDVPLIAPSFELHWTGKIPLSSTYTAWPRKMAFPVRA